MLIFSNEYLCSLCLHVYYVLLIIVDTLNTLSVLRGCPSVQNDKKKIILYLFFIP